MREKYIISVLFSNGYVSESISKVSHSALFVLHSVSNFLELWLYRTVQTSVQTMKSSVLLEHMMDNWKQCTRLISI